MIDDILQIEFLKTLSNLRVLSAENNKFISLNIHKQIFSNNLPFKSIIDQTFIKAEHSQVTQYTILPIYNIYYIYLHM